ncbi:MAG: hypothetical protein J3R72DRAFT_221974 [Linnemannia gamsii]|nr:MAG: hypothetical protein J3R72DRAFT_221974 [Linnemannia gamsii]
MLPVRPIHPIKSLRPIFCGVHVCLFVCFWMTYSSRKKDNYSKAVGLVAFSLLLVLFPPQTHGPCLSPPYSANGEQASCNSPVRSKRIAVLAHDLRVSFFFWLHYYRQTTILSISLSYPTKNELCLTHHTLCTQSTGTGLRVPIVYFSYNPTSTTC